MTTETQEQRKKREQQRCLFDSVAGLYDATRQGYPAEIVNAVVETAGIGRGSAVLEIGCGTGQLTRQLAGRALDLTAIDIGAAMVEAGRLNVMDPMVRFQVSPSRTSRTAGPSISSCRPLPSTGSIPGSAWPIAVLLARLRRIDPSRHASSELPRELTAVGKARSLAAGPLSRWGLDSLLPTAQLLISELVTNAVLYSEGRVTLRLINDGSLVCEVHGTSHALPRLRHASRDDESGRGLEIVSQMSHRW